MYLHINNLTFIIMPLYHLIVLYFQMKPQIGHYVRALHDFDTHEKGEITLRAGDVIKVTNVVDDNWLYGQLDCLEGNFPANFVESITLPNVQPSQKIFVAIDEFPAEQAGDLAISTG